MIESRPVEKGLVVVMDEKLNMSRQSVVTAWKANHSLGCIKRSVGIRLSKGIFPYFALVMPHCVQV